MARPGTKEGAMISISPFLRHPTKEWNHHDDLKGSLPVQAFGPSPFRGAARGAGPRDVVKRLHGPGLKVQRPKGLPLPLKQFKKILEEALARARQESEKLIDGLDMTDAEEILTKEVIERVLEGRFDDESDMVGYEQPSLPKVSMVSVSAFSLDLEIDYQGSIQWRGKAMEVEGHFELHLQQLEIEAQSRPADPNAPLRRLSSRTVDTGRYLLHWQNQTTFTIFDKESRLSTTIWGDPHVDLSDEQGSDNGEFADLTNSDMVTVMDLLDSSRVVIFAPDQGVIQRVEVVKGERSVSGAQGSFGAVERGVDQALSLLKRVPYDEVVVGGDGNDWFDINGRSVWGGSTP